jgi:hypothetical protein
MMAMSQARSIWRMQRDHKQGLCLYGNDLVQEVLHGAIENSRGR